MADLDLILARKLQEEFDKEYAVGTQLNPPNDFHRSENVTSSQGLSVIDPSWETTDPNPDTRALFLQFNDQYFWGKLAGVEVKWSPRMTLCAGVCSYEGRGGLCSIRLSVPLLKLRPRKDLVETLLHEMIHAFLFVTENDRDRDGHGPNFQKHMNRINKDSGSKITIYHDFHDEVDSYRQHWWRCDGPCRERRPYNGWVKRAMNRAPSPRDPWWAEHARSCGGSYTKVKEPEGYGAKKKPTGKEKKGDTEEQAGSSMDIRKFLGEGHTLGGGGQTNKPSTNVGGQTNKTNKPSTSGGQTNKTNKPSASGGQTNKINKPGVPARKKPSSTVTSATTSSSSDAGGWEGGGIWTPEKNRDAGSESGGGIWMPEKNRGTGSDRGGGIWTPEKNSEQSSGADWGSASEWDWDLSDIDQGNGPSGDGGSSRDAGVSGVKKTWTAVETQADRDRRINKIDRDRKTEIDRNKKTKTGQVDPGPSGRVLGGGDDSGLSWLAKMRKQWVSQDGGADKSSSSNIVRNSATRGSPEKIALNFLTLTTPEKRPGVLTTTETSDSNDNWEITTPEKHSPGSGPLSPQPDCHDDNMSQSSDDGSFHNSFHVSTCEEDNWPTPESYRAKVKIKEETSANFPQTSRKRKALSFDSCDEEENNVLLTVSKRAKPSPKTNNKILALSFDSWDEEDDVDDILPTVSKQEKTSTESRLTVDSWDEEEEDIIPTVSEQAKPSANTRYISLDEDEDEDEILPTVSKHTKPSAKVKRTVDSLDEDDILPIVSKRLKPPANVRLKVLDDSRDSDEMRFTELDDNRDSESDDGNHQSELIENRNSGHSRGDMGNVSLGGDVEVILEASAGASSVVTVSCPVCQRQVPADNINVHLDSCLS